MLEPHKELILNEKKDKSEKDKEELNKIENKINDTRYVDWMITTPIMLLVLILAFQYNSGQKGVKFSDYLIILLMNYGMLGSVFGEKTK